ncbi:MAG: TRAP transporter small permease [Rhodocyclaceae bacterium]|nr:TRAP transporter small permease [Rhodocyclaceae bacterium]
MAVDTVVNALCWLGLGVSALVLFAALLMIVYSVVMRYGFNVPQVWVDDLVGFALVAVVMLSAASVMRRGEHIGVDLLTNRLGRRGRRVASIWALIAVLVTAAFLIYEGWETVVFSKMLGILTHGYIEVPMYMVQMLLPIGGVLLALAALMGLARAAVGEPVATGGGHGHQQSAPERGPQP